MAERDGAPAAIECEGLGRRFGELVAVDDLTLRVSPGEVYALLGPNGAGKTTTVRVFCCLLAPSRGTARIFGHDVCREAPAVRAGVGLLTETPGLYDRLSPRQVLRFFAELHQLTSPVGRVDRLLERFGLRDQADAPAASLSKGMKQKVALARALIHEPRLVFLDEPTAGLDVPTQRLVRELVVELRAAGRTVVLTTHNLDEAERLADRVGVLSTRLVAEGTPAALRRRYQGGAVRITLEQASAAAAAAVRLVPGVRSVEPGDTMLSVVVADDGVTPDVVAAVVAAGGRVLAVDPERPRLEDVYLRLLGASEGSGALTP